MASSTFEFQVPDDWRIARLGDILLKGPSNGIYKSVEFQGSGISIVDMKGIFANRRIDNVNLNQIELTESEKKKFLLKKGDLVFARTSLKPEGVGLCSIVVDNSLPCVYESNVIRIRSNQSIAYPEYLAQFFWSSQGRRQIRRVIRQVAATSITGRDLAAIQVPLPPLNEQKIISTLLSDTDLGIELINKAIKHFKKLKKGLMQRLLTHGIGHTKFKKTKIGEIPESWEIRALGELSKINARSLNDKTDSESEIEYIEIASIEDPGYIGHTSRMRYSEAPSRARRIVRKGDVIVSTVRPYLKAIALIRQDSDDLVASTGFAVLTPLKNLDSEFLLQSVFSEYFMAYLTRRMVGSNYPAVTAKDIEQYQLACPPEKEQRRIASILRIVDEKMETERKYCIELECLKKGLMQVLLTGKVRVKV